MVIIQVNEESQQPITGDIVLLNDIIKISPSKNKGLKYD